MSSDKIDKLAAALCKAQAELTGAPKNKKNPHFRSEYADLDSVLRAVRPVLNKHGIALLQLADGEALETRLVHESGQWIAARTPVPPGGGKNPAQSYGASLSYISRYAAAAICGIAQSDDDAESYEAPAPSNGNSNGKGDLASQYIKAVSAQEGHEYRMASLKAARKVLSSDDLLPVIEAVLKSSSPADLGNVAAFISDCNYQGASRQRLMAAYKQVAA